MPVLAVPADGGRARPGNIVAAVDFSDFSRDALLAAVSIASPGARIHLAFVISTEQDLVKVKGVDAGAATVERVQADLAEWAKAAGVPNEFRLEFHSLEGKPAQEILRIAGRIDADLIAAGSHGAGFFGRTVLGSVSTAILRGAGCAVLVAPPRHR